MKLLSDQECRGR